MADTRNTRQSGLILASASPRRRMLLDAAGVKFTIVESRIVEAPRETESAADYAARTAEEKALAVSVRFPKEIVLGADTVVECEERILEKPADAQEARAMLQTLSGRTHTVVTAFAIARAGVILDSSSVSSRVTFRELSASEIDEYILSGEPFDKAGAYGIQGRGGGFISLVEGSRDNVMGLPVREVIAALERYGVSGARAKS